MRIYEKLMDIADKKGAGHLVLIDPDKRSPDDSIGLAGECQSSGVDGLLVGGSLLFSNRFDDFVKELKAAVDLPVILFPGSGQQVSAHADAILFMSLLSGRNPHVLIGEQVQAAPVVKACGIEAIGTAYLLIESGRVTSAEFMSNTRPIPAHKPEIAVAHALAAQYLGFKMIYLEAGSGAESPVPEKMIQMVCRMVDIPVIVGGGIRSPERAADAVRAGASFVVTGNHFEQDGHRDQLGAFVRAIHYKSKRADS